MFSAKVSVEEMFCFTFKPERNYIFCASLVLWWPVCMAHSKNISMYKHKQFHGFKYKHLVSSKSKLISNCSVILSAADKKQTQAVS